ncbi:WD40 repeat-like protein [Meredithblackwellia eburnea MCA 4105]
MAKSASDDERAPQYQLSALLQGHTDDVRSLATDNSSTLFSASRDSTARVWKHSKPDGGGGTTGGWVQERLFEGYHTGFINSVTWWEGDSDKKDHPGFVITSGQDSLIQVYDLSSEASSPSNTLVGHTSNVCALHTAGSTIVSGSWDFTARIWSTKTWECERVLEGHRAAVWDVLALSLKGYEGCAITASADNLIRLFKPNSESVSVVFKGHTQPVRALAKLLPEDEECILFASASNDCSIRIWDVAGNSITTLEGHESFIYALVSIPSAHGGGLASSGEDGIVKIWNEEEGEEEQEILVPALSVWSLTTLLNGDLAIACSDNMIWVFTRESSRKADITTQMLYEEKLSQRPKPTSSPFKSSSTALPSSVPIASVDDLKSPGKEGEVKIVEINGVMHAYQWESGNWSDLGEVTSGEPAPTDDTGPTGGPKKKKMVFEGEEYDYVFDIDVSDDSPALKLPFNFGDDPLDIAKDFVTAHQLPESYVERIADFVDKF